MNSNDRNTTIAIAALYEKAIDILVHFSDPAIIAEYGYGHRLHDEDPNSSAYVLTGHGLQSCKSTSSEYDPGLQEEHPLRTPEVPSPHDGCDVGDDDG